MRCCMSSIGVPEELWVWSLYVLSVLMLFPQGLSHNPETYRTGEQEIVVSVNMNVCDGLVICPGACPAYDPGRAPASWPYTGQALGKMYGIDEWMDVQYCEGSSPPSLCLSFSPPIHVSKQNHSKAIHLSKDNQKRKKEKERKKERKKERRKKDDD